MRRLRDEAHWQIENGPSGAGDAQAGAVISSDRHGGMAFRSSMSINRRYGRSWRTDFIFPQGWVLADRLTKTLARCCAGHLAPEIHFASRTSAGEDLAFLRSSLPIIRWRRPRPGYGAFDDVLLTLVALWASKRSHVLAPHGRLDRQSHGRAASGAQ